VALFGYRLWPLPGVCETSTRRIQVMAKALFGHVGVGPDMRLADEVRRLRSQVAKLEAELTHVRAVNDALAATVTVEDDLSTLALSETATV
jgi:hypothetical protein